MEEREMLLKGVLLLLMRSGSEVNLRREKGLVKFIILALFILVFYLFSKITFPLF